ncbi:peptide/nickel transport system substrate-binding protein [Pantoea ananatis]|uniref:ABC transporter substrate-binding protein n=1 Tax=Pantoea ananas TaxID=553 RepID=UPI000DC58FA3|nr:ABC transporter substrate-binding protein [Pantoea ananatis]RAR69044.1 peptide/nickel transport system substrate-binding protein [Pantoea ananatis]
MKQLKYLLHSTLACLLFASLSAGAAETKPVRIAAPFEIKGADPALSGDILLRMDVVETLVETDAKGAPVPALAESWQASPDGLQWRFTLRPGAHFHDGSPVTAESVVKSLNIARDKPGLLDKAPITSIEGEDRQVTVTLSEPFTPLLAVLAESRSQILALASWDNTNAVTRIIGSGPFQLVSFQPPQALSVKRFESYWGKKPAIAGAEFLSAGRAETRALLAESGDADYVFNLDAASRQRLSHKKSLQLLTVSVPRTVMLKLNLAHPFLSDHTTREALSLAINRSALANAVLRYPGAATQMFPPSMAEWHNPALPTLDYSPQRATALLTQSGWKAGQDGILIRNGQRFTLTLLTYPDRPELPLIAMVIQQQLRQIGIDVVINSTNSSEIPARHHDGSLQMALFARNFALTPDPTGTLLQDYGPQGGDWGAMNWHDKAFNEALGTLSQSHDPAVRQKAREVITTAFQRDLPVIPIAWYQQSAAVNASLTSVTLDPFERHFGLRDMQWVK